MSEFPALLLIDSKEILLHRINILNPCIFLCFFTARRQRQDCTPVSKTGKTGMTEVFFILILTRANSKRYQNWPIWQKHKYNITFYVRTEILVEKTHQFPMEEKSAKYFTASHSQSCKLVFPQICRQKSTRTTEHFQNILIHLHNNFFAAGF